MNGTNLTYYSHCIYCGFVLPQEAQSCSDCGIKKPPTERANRSSLYFKFILAFVLETLIICLCYLFKSNGWDSSGVVLLSLVFVYVIVSNVDRFKTLILKLSFSTKLSPILSLTESQKIIQRRLYELYERDTQISSILSRTKQSISKPIDMVVQVKLVQELETGQHQYVLYSLKLLELQIIRWQNKLSPLISRIETLSYSEIDSDLKLLELSKRTGLEWINQIKKLEKVESSLSVRLPVTPDNNSCQTISKIINETITSIETLHRAFLNQQALIVLGRNSTTNIPTPSSDLSFSFRDLDIFNFQVSLTDFSTSFQAIESEYARNLSKQGTGFY